MSRTSILLAVAAVVLAVSPSVSLSQQVVDKNKGTPYEIRNGMMDGNLVGTIYYNYGEVGDWQNFPTVSGVWPKGTNHTYIDGVAMIVQAEAKDAAGNMIHPLETNYYEYVRTNQATN